MFFYRGHILLIASAISELSFNEMIGGYLVLNQELFNELIILEIPARFAPPKGYFWKVIHDPTRNDVDPGLFFGSYFRLLDIYPDIDEVSSWPDGIIFEHIQTGQQLPKTCST